MRVITGFVSMVVLTLFTVVGHCEKPNNVADFMQLKLGHSQKLLEGIALEDFAMIEKSSQSMSLLCEDELWRVFQTPEYSVHSEQFRRTANKITEAARKKNLDGATLGYVALTMQCVNCHKYVRDVRRADVGGTLHLLGADVR